MAPIVRCTVETAREEDELGRWVREMQNAVR